MDDIPHCYLIVVRQMLYPKGTQHPAQAYFKMSAISAEGICAITPQESHYGDPVVSVHYHSGHEIHIKATVRELMAEIAERTNGNGGE